MLPSDRQLVTMIIHIGLSYQADGITRKLPSSSSNTSIQLYVTAYFTFWKDGLKEVKL
jgi:hypothetical protein